MQPDENSQWLPRRLTAPLAFPAATLARAGHAAGRRGDTGESGQWICDCVRGHMRCWVATFGKQSSLSKRHAEIFMADG